jgi:putative DNA primase/helicase
LIAAQIAAALGNSRHMGGWWRCVCPVHGSRTGRSLSLALRDHPRGLAVRCHAGCDPCEVLAELRRLGLLGGHSEGARQSHLMPRSNDTSAARRAALAQRIWDTAGDARRSPVERYLPNRGITIPPPLSLRWTPRCPHPTGIYLPAMVTRIDNADGTLIGIHRTFLRLDGNRKAEIDPVKAMLGSTAGGAVRFAPAAETLLVGEGIETCLAAMQATELPAWAALSTSGMMALQLPPEVPRVVILADNDHNGAGLHAARVAAQRWVAEGRRVRIAMPPEPGTDMADLLVGRSHVRTAEVSDAAA